MARFPAHESVTPLNVASDLEAIANTTSEAVLESYALHPSPTVRRDVAAHPNLGPETMALLVDDPYLDVKRALVLRRDLPMPLRERLFEHSFRDSSLADLIACAPTTPSHLLAAMLEKAGEDDSFSPFTIMLALRNGHLDHGAIPNEVFNRAQEFATADTGE